MRLWNFKDDVVLCKLLQAGCQAGKWSEGFFPHNQNIVIDHVDDT